MRDLAWHEVRFALVPVALFLVAILLTGCAYDYYEAGDEVRVDRYGQAWERCHVRGGYPAWCRAPY